MESDKVQSTKLRKYNNPAAGIKVLVVDADSTSLAIVSKMLRSLGYEVVTATLASDALSIIVEKKNELNLVLVEACLPDMDISELTEKIRESSDLPSFIMADDDNQHSISKALCRGATLCFRKPVLMSNLSGLWRFAKQNRKCKTIASEDVQGFWWRQVTIVKKGLECQPFVSIGKHSLRSAKREEQELRDKDNGGGKIESSGQKRKRVSWTDDLQMKFFAAVKLAGINAPPRKMHQLMNVPGLTKEHVSNYLQKYRQSMRERAKGKHLPFPKQQGVIHNQAFQGNNQNDLSNGMSWKPQRAAHNDNGYISVVENTTDEFLSYVDSIAEQSEMHYATLLANDMCHHFSPKLPVPPLLPSDEKEYYLYGAEAGKIDEIFYSSKGTRQFSDEDLTTWLSSLTIS